MAAQVVEGDTGADLDFIGAASETGGDPVDETHDWDRVLAQALEGLGDRLKAEWRAAGVAYYVEADPQGRVVYRHVDTDEVMTREQAEQLC